MDVIESSDVAETEQKQEAPDVSPPDSELVKAQFRFLKDAIKSTYDSKFGEIFRCPVDPVRDNVPDYFDVIKSPMDLGTIINKLDNNEYVDPGDVSADFRLMIDNCCTYNPDGSGAFQRAKELNRVFNKKMVKFPIELPPVHLQATKRRNISSSPREVDDSIKDLKNRAKIRKIANPPTERPASLSVQNSDNNRESRQPKRIIKDKVDVDKQSSLSPAFNYCLLAINELFQKRHLEYARPFLSPVDPILLNIPDYYDVIKCPMDLGTVRAKLKTDQYTHPQQAIRDIRLVFTNCYRYNAQGTEVYESANKLQAVFEHFMASCPQEVFFELFVNDEAVASEDIASYQASVIRGTRRSQHIENRQILESLQNIDRRLAQISDDVNKIKSDKTSSRHVGFSENGTTTIKKMSLKSLAFPTSKSIQQNIPKTDLEKIDDVDPMTYDEKLALSSQIMCLPEAKIKEILGIINQKEPWSRRLSSSSNKDLVEIDLESLQPSTLRALEKYINTQQRKKSDYNRKKCTAEQRQSREQDLRVKLQQMEHQLSGKLPIAIGGKNLSSVAASQKSNDAISRLSDSSSESEISDDEFAKRYSLAKYSTSSQSSATNVFQNASLTTSTSVQPRSVIGGKEIDRNPQVTSSTYKSGPSSLLQKDADSKIASDNQKPTSPQQDNLKSSSDANFGDGFLSKLGIAKNRTSFAETTPCTKQSSGGDSTKSPPTNDLSNHSINHTTA